MSDLIRRSELLKQKTYLYDPVLGYEACVCVDDIVSAPTVDAVPVDEIKIRDIYVDAKDVRVVFQFGKHGITVTLPCDKLARVVHGRWEEWWPGISVIMTGEEMLYRCSVCDAKYPDKEGYRYCPNCGAKMDLEDEP